MIGLRGLRSKVLSRLAMGNRPGDGVMDLDATTLGSNDLRVRRGEWQDGRKGVEERSATGIANCPIHVSGLWSIRTRAGLFLRMLLMQALAGALPPKTGKCTAAAAQVCRAWLTSHRRMAAEGYHRGEIASMYPLLIWRSAKADSRWSRRPPFRLCR